ncbi:hypothetical protein FJY94_02395 [Candidatus Kaiserbacteria bacterium]|nr:hypothetical protein [Candidatus Kaiserbacteria bacterium]
MRKALFAAFLSLAATQAYADPVMLMVWKFDDKIEYAKTLRCLQERRVPYVPFGVGGLDFPNDGKYRFGIEWAMNTTVTDEQRELASACLPKE